MRYIKEVSLLISLLLSVSQAQEYVYGDCDVSFQFSFGLKSSKK